MKLNCLSCGHTVDLHNDYNDYNGQVKCFVCGALLTVRTARRRREERDVVYPHLAKRRRPIAEHGLGPAAK